MQRLKETYKGIKSNLTMMNFQILDADYAYSDGKPVVRLYGRDESGNSVCCSVPDFEPYFYAKAQPDKRVIDTDVINIIEITIGL